MHHFPPWVSTLDSCIAQSQQKTFTFCTISQDNMPKARTCKFRSWLFNDNTTGVLLFTADKRSNKINDLAHQNGKFEACFYFQQYGMQVRLSGFTEVLSGHQYPSLIDLSRYNNFSTHPPSPSTTPNLYPMGADVHPHDSHSYGQQYQQQQFMRRLSVPPPSDKYPVVSPSFKASHDIYSYHISQLPAPTPDEWLTEYYRVWSIMRRATQDKFKRPPPGDYISAQSAALLDSIARGVDGRPLQTSLENFTVIVMFVNHADVLRLGSANQRVLYHRANDDEWVEENVCP